MRFIRIEEIFLTVLSELKIEESSRSELVHLAEGIRDSMYRPCLDARERSKREAAELETMKRKRAEFGMAYADDELRGEDLGMHESWRIRSAVNAELERKLTGQEPHAVIAGLADRIIDRELS